MRRWTRRLLVVAILLAAVVALRYTVFRPDPVPVTVFVVGKGRVEQTVTNSKAGTVKTRHRAKLSPEIGGRVIELPARKGEQVRSRSVLLRIEDTPYRAEVTLAERALDAARSQQREACLAADLAERDLARVEGLVRDQIVSEQEIDQARSRRDVRRTGCESAKARASQAAAQVEVARAQLERTVLRAPFDGIVADLSTELGEWITPSPPGIPMPPVLDLIDTESIYVSAPLDEIDIGKVSVGQPVRITMDPYPGRSFAGHVTRVAPYVQDVAEQSRTFEVEAVFDDAAFARTLPPGASADIEVILGASDEVLRVPAYALLEGKRVLALERSCPGDDSLGGRAEALLLAKRGECLVSKDVDVGLKNWEFAEIRKGLTEGDRVVVSLDRAEVKDGARARQTAVAEK
jgi:HlyD family secretion protein